jgi:DNA topoisomerase-1
VRGGDDRLSDPAPDPRLSNLFHVDVTGPGITRVRDGDGWIYLDPGGDPIADAALIARLNAIGLPPAYQDCWFCPSPDGHIQAIGHDARGRRQYRYHVDFRAAREDVKFDACLAFARALPRIRARVARDLEGPARARETVLAAVVRLLDGWRLRVGNRAYEKANRSYGATTLKRRHARLTRKRLFLSYVGKAGKAQSVSVDDARVLRVVRRLVDLPGQRLFQWLDDEGGVREVGSGDVNAYLRAIGGEGFSAKHFRTWGASALAFEEACAAFAAGRRPKAAELAGHVAAHLGNTPAVARRAYIHSAVMGLCAPDATPPPARMPRPARHMNAAERALIGFLEGESGLSRARADP